MNTLITRQDVKCYVCDSLPWTELTDWDIDGIVDAMLDRWPTICAGNHPEIANAPIGAVGGPAGWYIGQQIDGDEFWRIVQDKRR